MKFRYVLAPALLFVFTSVTLSARPAAPGPKASISVSVPGLNCSTDEGTDSFSVSSWSWGASSTGGFPGGGDAKVSLQDLHFTRTSDACSPALIGAVTSGTPIKSLTLTQRGADGVVTATLSLTAVSFSSWQIGGSANTADAQESVSVNFAQFCFTNTATGSKFCYNGPA